MASFCKALRPGTILRTNIGECYVYLGKYKGIPRSFYNRPSSGYMYLYLGDSKPDGASNEYWVEDNLIRLGMGIDGNACYTRHYKQFKDLITIQSISKEVIEKLNVYGLTRIGDK